MVDKDEPKPKGKHHLNEDNDYCMVVSDYKFHYKFLKTGIAIIAEKPNLMIEVCLICS